MNLTPGATARPPPLLPLPGIATCQRLRGGWGARRSTAGSDGSPTEPAAPAASAPRGLRAAGIGGIAEYLAGCVVLAAASLLLLRALRARAGGLFEDSRERQLAADRERLLDTCSAAALSLGRLTVLVCTCTLVHLWVYVVCVYLSVCLCVCVYLSVSVHTGYGGHHPCDDLHQHGRIVRIAC